MQQLLVVALLVCVSNAKQTPRLKGSMEQPRPHLHHQSKTPSLPDTKTASETEPLRPHIIYALIDDLGYAGLGFNSPEG